MPLEKETTFPASILGTVLLCNQCMSNNRRASTHINCQAFNKARINNNQLDSGEMNTTVRAALIWGRFFTPGHCKIITISSVHNNWLMKKFINEMSFQTIYSPMSEKHCFLTHKAKLKLVPDSDSRLTRSLIAPCFN